MSLPCKAIVCHDTLDNGGWKMENITTRHPREGELLVEMVASGICHTDALIGGIPDGAAPIAFYPRVLGHEGSGYVKEIGSGVTVAQPGDPVLLSYAFCEKCEICKAGHTSHCPEFTPLNFGDVCRSFGSKEGGESSIGGTFFGQSSFSNLSIVKQCSVVNVKGIVKDRNELQLFAPLGCGIQTGSGTVINAAQATEKDVVCIMGLGGVGLSAVMGAKLQGCRTIIGVDKVGSRLKLAKDFGATHVIDGSDMPEGKELGDVVKEYADGIGPTVTIDTTGVPGLIKAGVAFTRNRGKIIQVGSPPFDFNLEIEAFSFMLSGKQFLGAIEGQAYPPEYVPKMIKW
jgi:Zn-dependent alcohol dehydrogenase